MWTACLGGVVEGIYYGSESGGTVNSDGGCGSEVMCGGVYLVKLMMWHKRVTLLFDEVNDGMLVNAVL